MKKGNCHGKVKFCRINHSWFGWKMSRADVLFSRLLAIPPDYQDHKAPGSDCHECDKCWLTCKNMDGMETHTERNHA